MVKERIGLGILVSGRGSNFQAILDAIGKGSLLANVNVVISDRPEVEALERAKKLNVQNVCVEASSFGSREAHERALVKILESSHVDLVVLAGYRRLLSTVLIQAFKNRIINIHPSILPAFRGLKAQKQALDYGVRISGCTVHLVEEEMDGGPIIVQAAVPVFPDDTEESLSSRILDQEHRIYPLAIQWFAEGRINVEGRQVFVQDFSHQKEMTLANPLTCG
ncbi:MAG TPA: phosphoribosylglycinamide formyltransferase [Nitrospiria bacterium]|jgi:phosphoribosylglycinamide formyltransferase-1